MDAANAQKTWEMVNNVEIITGVDEIYKYDKKQQQDILTAKPWEKEYVTSFCVIFLVYLYTEVFEINLKPNFF